MRAALLASLALAAATPVAAQDHSAHRHRDQPGHDHAAHAGHDAKSAPHAMDHCAMGHLPPEQCPPRDPARDVHVEHGQMNHGRMDHSQHAMPSAADKSAPGAAPESAVPPRALEGPPHAADAIWGADAMRQSREESWRMHGGMITGMVMVEGLEARIPASGGKAGWLWDAQAWHGGDIDKFVLKTEGEAEPGHGVEKAEIQTLWGHAIGPFFDLQAGVRLDLEPRARGHLVLGVQGLAPYMAHVDLAAFLSDRGDLTARLKGEYDQKITQRLIIQPRVEVELAAQDIPERAIAAGLVRIEPGLRLRYEIVREFSPYVGLEYEALLGDTSDMARAIGEDPSGWKVVLGLRAWF